MASTHLRKSIEYAFLGYDLVPDEQRLVVNPEEAQRVRAIFRVYLEKESVLAAVQTLNARDWTTKRWTAANGNVIGGRPFDRANLHGEESAAGQRLARRKRVRVRHAD
jgi:hypothetical protein